MEPRSGAVNEAVNHDSALDAGATREDQYTEVGAAGCARRADGGVDSADQAVMGHARVRKHKIARHAERQP
jgi:hypothetical protein